MLEPGLGLLKCHLADLGTNQLRMAPVAPSCYRASLIPHFGSLQEISNSRPDRSSRLPSLENKKVGAGCGQVEGQKVQAASRERDLRQMTGDEALAFYDRARAFI